MDSLLIENAAILADASGAFIERGDILIEDGQIAAVGQLGADPGVRRRDASTPTVFSPPPAS